MATRFTYWAACALASLSGVRAASELEIWDGSSTFPYWQMGQYVYNEYTYYPACFPNHTLLDATWPCSGLQVFYPNCTFGLSLNAVLAEDPSFMVNPFDSKVMLQQLSYASQQACYCQSDYWEYVRGCNSCMFLHGYEQLADWNNGYANWIPSDWVDQQSSAYCGAATVTQPALDFLASFTPKSSSPLPPATPSSAIPSTVTAVSDYFSPTNTLAVPTQTSQIGSLLTTSTSRLSSSGAGSARITAAPALIGGAGLAFVAVGQLA